MLGQRDEVIGAMTMAGVVGVFIRNPTTHRANHGLLDDVTDVNCVKNFKNKSHIILSLGLRAV